MTLDIASQAHPDGSAFDQIMAEEQRFGEPPGKHPVEDKSRIDGRVWVRVPRRD
jgi:hypothetical protein